MSSEYMRWAKTHLQAKYNLASSGMTNFPLAGLPATLDDLELTGPSYYGYEPLQHALAAKTGAPLDSIVAATGTSMANHLAMAALIEPGDEVLIEQPTYELLVSTAEYIGADVRRFKRSEETGFQIDPEEIERHITPKTRLIVITNLHNPTCVYTDEKTLASAGEIARKADCHVLVDEVYLDAAFERAPRSAFHLGPEFVVTSSLTKVYGLGGLRCGWILAEPDLARRIWRLNDLFGVIPAHAAERLSVIALNNLAMISDRSRRLIETNSAILNSFFQSQTMLEWRPHQFGTVSFPRLKNGSVDELSGILMDEYETSIVPGKYFEMPQHFRLGLGGETEIFEAGLERLVRVLKRFE